METGSSSLRARVARRVLHRTVTTLRARSGGLPDPDGPAEAIDAYGLAVRDELERLGSRLPVSRGTTIRACDVGVPGEWVEVPDAADSLRVVLHLHGGAYVMGSPRTHRGLAAALSRACRAPVVVPDYRLAPEHPFPAAVDDAVAVWHWLTEVQGVDPARIAVTGDSAGGGLGLALMVRLRDEGHALPACYAGMSPWTDLAGTGASMVTHDGLDPWLTAALVAPAGRRYAGEAPLDHPWVSPLYADLTGLPPLLLHVGEREILLDDARRLVDRARAAGVDASVGVFPGMWHVFHVFPGLPEARRAVAEIGGFVRRHTGGW